MLSAFKRIASEINTKPLLNAVEAHPELWSEIIERQTTPGTPHVDTSSIFLRWAESRSIDAAFNDVEAIDYPAFQKLPEARDLIASLANSVGSQKLGRVMIVSLMAGGSIIPHDDQGAYADYYERFHIPLQSASGNYFYVETEPDQGEFVHMKEGEAWWFNHKKKHFALNASQTPRIHLIMDMVAKSYRKER